MRTRARVPLAAIVVAILLAAVPLTSAAADTVTDTIPVISVPSVISATPTGSKVVIVSVTNTVSVLDVASGVESAPVSLGASAYNVAVSPNGATAIVPTVNGDLWFVNTATSVVSAPVSYGVYLFDVVFSLDGSRAYVTTGSNSIVIVDVATHAELGRFTLDPATRTHGIDLSPDGATLTVTDISASTLSRIAVATGLTTGSFTTGPFPSEVAVRADGWAYIGSFVASTIGSVDPAGNFLPIALSGSGPVTAIALSPDDSRLYVPRGFDNRVAIVDTSINTEIAPVISGVDTRGIAFTADGTTAFAGDLGTPAVLVIAVDRPPVLAGVTPAATIGVPYSFAVRAGGSPAPTLALTGTLPAGLAFDPASGTISGTPTALGSSSFSVTATNGSGTATQAYTLVVAAALAATGVSPAPLVVSAVALLALGLTLLRRRSRYPIQETSGVR